MPSVRCPHCGYNVAGKIKYCPNCRKSLDVSDTGSTNHSYSFGQFKTIVVVTLAIIIVGGIVFGVYMKSTESQRARDRLERSIDELNKTRDEIDSLQKQIDANQKLIDSYKGN